MKISVLIPDGESHLLIYVINSLSQIKGIDIYVMSNVEYIFMRSSRYIQHFSYYPKTKNQQDWIANINNEVRKHQIDLVMPIFELGIEKAIKYRTHIEGDKLCLLPSSENFAKARNKWLLTRHLLENDISFPDSILYSRDQSLTINDFAFPVILKPTVVSGGGDGVYFFQNKNELQAHLVNNQVSYEQIIQEYVTGYDIGCSVLCSSGEILAFTIQKATMLNSNPFKPLLGVEFVYDEELYKLVTQLMKSLDWSGVAHIDLKYDTVNNIYKVIEVNTRFWGSLDASLIAGVNFPYLYCMATLKNNFDLPKYELINYLNLKGLVKSIMKDKSYLIKMNFILKNTPVGLAIKDPLPTVFKYLNFSKKIIYSKLKFTSQKPK